MAHPHHFAHPQRRTAVGMTRLRGLLELPYPHFLPHLIGQLGVLGLCALLPGWAAAQSSPGPASAPAASAGARSATSVQGQLNPTSPNPRSGKAVANPQAVGCLIGPLRSADIGSPVTGIIDRMVVDVGDSVKQGQPVVMLRADVETAGERAAHTRWSLDADVRASEASLELSRQRHQRAVELLASGFVSPQAVEQASTELRLAEQRLAQSKGQRAVLQTDLEVAKTQVNQRTVRAPFDGVVIERFRHPGERVEDRPLLRVASLDPLRVDLIVPATRFGQYRLRDQISITPELPGTSPVNAEVTHVDRVIDAASNTFRVRLNLPNPGHRLPAGARCNAETPAVTSTAATPAPRL
jgi:cobalt-zinc-cadmium efflux system membrane fusion protein